MEAIAALSLAANALQFVEFGFKVLSHGSSLKRSADGALKEHSELNTVINHLDDLLSQLDGRDAELATLVERCKEIGAELKSALSKVARRKGGGVWSSYRAALAAVWNKNTLDEMERRLERLRAEISLQLQVSARRATHTLSSQVKAIEINTADTNDILYDMDRSNKDEARVVDDRLRQIADSILNNAALQLAGKQELQDQFRAMHDICEEIKSYTQPQRNDQLSSEAPDKNRFLETLDYRGMNDREDSISDAHARTFQWLLMEPASSEADGDAIHIYHESRTQLRSDVTTKLKDIGLGLGDVKAILPPEAGGECPAHPLQQFLSSSSRIFWIWGKPGCGKSTLMKAMIEKRKVYRRLKDLLETWSSQHKLLIAKFFFYRAGTDLQKSHLGLLQSLLHQLLSQHNNLIDCLFSKKQQREAIARSVKSSGSDMPIWTLQELQKSFTYLAREEGCKIYLHIDGIDEMDGTTKAIADIISDIRANNNVKILVSGRWTTPFADAFGIANSLNLHETTELDIAHYTVDHLLKDKMQELLSTPKEFVTVLADILSAAEGVFLWVKIVIDSLFEGATHFESFKELHSRLNEYPKDLDQLYWFLFEHIEKRYRVNAAFWLRAIQTHQGSSREQIKADILAISDIFNPKYIESFSSMHDYARDTKRNDRSRAIMNRVRAQCPHLIDFRPPKGSPAEKRLVFAHRTVLDFVTQQSIQERLQVEAPKAKDVYRIMSAAKVCAGPHYNDEPSTLEGLIQSGTGSASDLDSLSEQVIHFFQSTPKKLNLFSRVKEAVTCTTEGWFCEAFGDKLSRLSACSNPLLRFKLALGVADFEVLRSCLAVQWFSDADKVDMFLERFRFNYPPSAGAESVEMQFYEELFAQIDAPEQVQIIWRRVLESARLAGGLRRHHYPSAYSYNSRVKRYLELFCRWIPAILRKGADPNILCSPMWLDLDKSLKSPASIFLTLRDLFQEKPLGLSLEELSSLTQSMDLIIEEVKRKGGEELVIRSGSHQAEVTRPRFEAPKFDYFQL